MTRFHSINNKQGFSLVFAMGIVIVITLLAMMILEYMIPFSKNVKGIENSSRSYYEANAGIEDALYFMKNEIIGSQSGTTMTTGPVGSQFDILAVGNTLPPMGRGNSEYDIDMNILRQGVPLQLEIGQDLTQLDITNLRFQIKVPNIGGFLQLSGGDMPIINWQLSSVSTTLNSATGSYITVNDIDNDIDGSSISFYNKIGVDLNDIATDFQTFYSNNCMSSCVLKLSIINTLEGNDGTPIPYLEWKITSDESLPLRYTIINTSGKSYGFKKSLEVKIPGKSVSEAFDFTVFQ